MKKLKWSAAFAIALILIAAAFTVATSATSSTVYLSDIDYVSEIHGWGELMRDKGLDGKAIKICETTYEKGITIHADSRIEYDISGKGWNTFSAYIGVNDSEEDEIHKPKSSITFEILVDGISVYRSGIFRMSTPAEKITVSLPSDAKRITLITDGTSDGNTADHCAWADAKFEYVTPKDGNMKSLEFDMDSISINGIMECADLTPRAFDYLGKEIDPSKFKVSYTSSASDIALVFSLDAISGRVVLKSKGIATVTATAVHEYEGLTTVCRSEITVFGKFGDEARANEELSSPDGKIKILVKSDEFGRVRFSVTDDGAAIVTEAGIGVNTDSGDFSSGLAFVGAERGEINESYSNISGSYSKIENRANTLDLTFAKLNFTFTVKFRAYDDGFAYRYVIGCDEPSVKDITIKRETGYFTIPKDSKVFAERIARLEDKFSYQNNYDERTADKCEGMYQAFPMLSTADDEHWLLLSEAELYGDRYIGTALYGEGEGRFSLCPAPRVSSDEAIDTALAFTSPWRCGIIGSLGEVVESSLIEKVCERSDEDYSWVRPGVCSWLWLSEGGAASHDYKLLRKYVNLSVEMGWEYILLDAVWQPNAPHGYYDGFLEFMDYAKENGVGVWVWVNKSNLDTESERAALAKWASDGIVGVKVDFFDSEDADNIELYEAIYEACRENKLMLNLHGSNKPTGERSYWQHVINREAVLGEEKNNYRPSDLATYIYTRGVLGPMDITPRITPGGSKVTTIAAQLAMCVHYETGALTMASFASDYYNSPAKEFFKALPAAWDDLHFIDGYPGDYSIIARRSGENWYLSGLNATQRLDASIALDFLDADGEYRAYVFADGEGKDDLDIYEIDVTASDSIDVTMLYGGGLAVKIVRLDSPEEEPDCGGLKPIPPTEKPMGADNRGGEVYRTLIVVSAIVGIVALSFGLALVLRRFRK